jgi:hypothetical protein
MCQTEMSKNFGYGWEKLHTAVHCLCGKKDQRSRLAIAVLALHPLSIRPEEHYLPETIQTEFCKFMKEMTSQKAIGDEGAILATVNSLDESEISAAVEKIISFYDAVCRYQKPD